MIPLFQGDGSGWTMGHTKAASDAFPRIHPADPFPLDQCTDRATLFANPAAVALINVETGLIAGLG